MQNSPVLNDLRMTVYCALFTALIIIGGYISIPIPVGPVPIVLADFFVMLAGLFLGCKYGLISTLLFLVLGVIGLPVFNSGNSGLAVFFGPTGGFLFGYLLMVAAVGLISNIRKPSLMRNIFALLIGNALLYSIGVPWFKIIMNLDWAMAFAVAFVPFIAGMVIKIAVAVTLANTLVPRFRQTISVSSRQPADSEEI